jgi:glycosyltransferase involved in cell wall biosynthesis
MEVIIVDNASDDRTKEIARNFTDRVYDHGPERSAQRNYGVMQAKGIYVLYLDADMILSDTVVSDCFEMCESESLAGMYIPEIIVGNGFWIAVRNFERSFYNGTCIDGVRFIRRELFLELGGFDLSLTGPEDWDLDRRVNDAGRTAVARSPLHHNEGDFEFRRYLAKKSYYAGTFENYIAKWGAGDPVIKKQLGPLYRYLGVFIENGKWKKLITRPHLAGGMYLLRFLVGVQYLRKRFS